MKMKSKTLNKYGLNERNEKAIFRVLSRYDDIKSVLLFGSRAKGDFHEGSDIDLAIKDSNISNQTLRKIKSDFEESDLPFRVDVLDYSKLEETALKEHIERVGKVIIQV
jgi:predicted nucleotidyltransferase